MACFPAHSAWTAFNRASLLPHLPSRFLMLSSVKPCCFNMFLKASASRSPSAFKSASALVAAVVKSMDAMVLSSARACWAEVIIPLFILVKKSAPSFVVNMPSLARLPAIPKACAISSISSFVMLRFAMLSSKSVSILWTSVWAFSNCFAEIFNWSAYFFSSSLSIRMAMFVRASRRAFLELWTITFSSSNARIPVCMIFCFAITLPK